MWCQEVEHNCSRKGPWGQEVEQSCSLEGSGWSTTAHWKGPLSGVEVEQMLMGVPGGVRR